MYIYCVNVSASLHRPTEQSANISLLAGPQPKHDVQTTSHKHQITARQNRGEAMTERGKREVIETERGPGMLSRW